MRQEKAAGGLYKQAYKHKELPGPGLVTDRWVDIAEQDI